MFAHRLRWTFGLAELIRANGPAAGNEVLSCAGDDHRRIDFDLQYIGKASVLLDLTILVKTIREVAASAEAF